MRDYYCPRAERSADFDLRRSPGGGLLCRRPSLRPCSQRTGLGAGCGGEEDEGPVAVAGPQSWHWRETERLVAGGETLHHLPCCCCYCCCWYCYCYCYCCQWILLPWVLLHYLLGCCCVQSGDGGWCSQQCLRRMMSRCLHCQCLLNDARMLRRMICCCYC